jgi:hypothetical protein
VTDQSEPAASGIRSSRPTRSHTPASAFRADEWHREIADVAVLECPEWLEVRHGAQLPEARDVGGIDQLDVREGRAAVARAALALEHLDRVQRRAHGAIADCVYVELDARGVECERDLAQAHLAP